MRYKFILSNTAYKVMRVSDAFAPQIYRAVSLTLRLKMPDGTPLKGQTININGTDMVTGPTGQVILTGDMGLTAKLHIVYNVTYIADVEVTYTSAAVYDVALEQHVAAGSVTISEWAFSSTSYAKKPYTLVVPPVVTVVKMTGSKRSSGTKVKAGYIGTNGEAIQHGDVEIAYLSSYSGNSFEKYVGVTPGETYTIYGRNVKDAVIEWSDEINTHAVDVTI